MLKDTRTDAMAIAGRREALTSTHPGHVVSVSAGRRSRYVPICVICVIMGCS